jgi:hypothetical protein
LDKFVEDVFRSAGELVVKLFNPYNKHPGFGAKKMYYCRALGVNYAYYQFGQGRTTRKSFVKYCLNHSSDIAADNYMWVYVVASLLADETLSSALSRRLTAVELCCDEKRGKKRRREEGKYSHLEDDEKAAAPAAAAAEDDEGKVTHVALKKIGHNPSAGNRETVNVAVFTDAEKRAVNKRFKASDAAAKQTHITDSANRIAAALHAKHVSKKVSVQRMEKLGVPRDIAKVVKARLVILQPQQQ